MPRKTIAAVMVVALRSAGCAAEGHSYVECDSGPDRSVCESNNDETLYCKDYNAPADDDCEMIDEDGGDSVWCCPD